ncbi:MAG: alanine racemase, partial [Clostridiales Family XIII bacterium]|nr:alanine racemase [Clostridiales Family XIII bacterium]
MYNDTRRAAWVEIDLGKITDNYKALSGLAPGAKTIPCLKADAYGHGAIKVAWELIKAGADYIGVATLFEAVELRQAGIGKPIVLLGPTPRGNTRDVIDLNILSIITTYEDAWLLSETATRIAPGKTIDVFIALDTGMGRIGFLFTEKDLDQITQIAALPNLKITGLLSHFSAADEEDLSFSEYQLGRLKRFEEVLADRGIRPEMTTIANSAGIIHLPASHLSAIRPGISLYGFAPNEDIPVQTITLEPAMQVKANIVFL